MARNNEGLTYKNLISKYKIGGKCSLMHCLIRTSKLMYWDHGMACEGTSYLNDYDTCIFLEIIRNACDDSNCIPTIYAVSLAYYLKKRRNERVKAFLRHLQLYQLEKQCEIVFPPSKSWINHVLIDSDIRIASGQQIEFMQRMPCNIPTIFFFEIHKELFKRDPALILNMDETMLSARKRLKVLGKKK